MDFCEPLPTHLFEARDSLDFCERQIPLCVCEIFDHLDPFKDVPRTKWRLPKEAPGIAQIALLTTIKNGSDIALFFQKMTAMLIPGETLEIVGARHFSFHRDSDYFFSEILLKIDDKSHLALLEHHLPAWAEKIEMALRSKLPLFYPFSQTSPVFNKNMEIHQRIIALVHRFGDVFEEDICHDVQHFFLHFSKEFCAIRRTPHLVRMICAHYLFRKEFIKNRSTLSVEKPLFVKVMPSEINFPFGMKKVLGLSIGLNNPSEYECFEQRHILKAVQRWIPTARAVTNSFHCFNETAENMRTLYSEFEKSDGEEFTSPEIRKLRQVLKTELKNSIERLSPSLFTPRNEEELYRNILILSQELRFFKDLPQAMISFGTQSVFMVRFNVVLLRILFPGTPSVHELASKLPSNVGFHLERVTQVGFLRKKYAKEANVFALEIDPRPFFRKDHSIDLVRIRQHLVKILEQMVGSFRDYNGGLLQKQNEQLEDLKKSLGQRGKDQEFALESFYYSLTPPMIQSRPSNELGRQFALLFLKALNISIPLRAEHLLIQEHFLNAFAIVLKCKSIEMRDEVFKTLKNQKFEYQEYCCSSVEIEKEYYLSFLHLYPSFTKANLLIERIHKSIHEYEENKKHFQYVRAPLPSLPQSVDPQFAVDLNSRILLKTLYEGLFRIGPDGKAQLAGAQSMEISEDQTRYIFHLRSMFWSNGEKVTASDFEYAWKRQMSPTPGAPRRDLFRIIKNAKRAKNGEISLDEVGVKALDEMTLQVDLEHPSPYFLDLIATSFFSPFYHGKQSGLEVIGNGPFLLSYWEKDKKIQLVRNPHYWDAGSVKLQKLDFLCLPDPLEAAKMFEAGELDCFGSPFTPAPSSETISRPHETQTFGTSGAFWFCCNTRTVPLNSVKIRLALSAALNREKIIAEVVKEGGPYRGVIPASMSLLANDKHFISYDPTRAKEYFEQGLQDLGLTSDQLPLIKLSYADLPNHGKIADAVRNQWLEAFPLKIELEELDWKVFSSNLGTRHFQIGGCVWHSASNDPMTTLEYFKEHSTPYNASQWENPQFKKILEIANRETDVSKRRHYLQQAELLLLEEMPIIPVYTVEFRTILRKGYKGLSMSKSGPVDFKYSYIDKEP